MKYKFIYCLCQLGFIISNVNEICERYVGYREKSVSYLIKSDCELQLLGNV
jgi:hypothetical protein